MSNKERRHDEPCATAEAITAADGTPCVQEPDARLRLTRLMVEKCSTGFFWLDAAGRVLDANQEACASLRCAVSELRGRHAWDFEAHLDPQGWARRWAEMSRLGLLRYQAQYRRPDGSLVPVEVSANHVEVEGQAHAFVYARDISERKLTERRLRLTQTAVEQSKTAFFFIDPRGGVVDVNAHACANLGYSREELVGADVWLFDPVFPREAWPGFWEEFRRKGVMNFETRHRRKDGSVFPVEITCHHIVVDGEEQGGFTFVQDITQRKQAERQLKLADAAINKSSVSFYWLTPAHQVRWVNDHACASLGYSREELIGKYVWDFDPDFPPEAGGPAWAETRRTGSITIETRHRRKDGTVFPVEVTTNYIRFEDEEHSFVFVKDISERKAAEDQIRNLAFFDPLTGLPNRRMLTDRLRLALAVSGRRETHGAILFIDLDNFKGLNDTRGHDVGDLLLTEVAERLRSVVREGDTVARLGGDEFVVMIEEVDRDAAHAAAVAKAVADKILAELRRPCQLRGQEHVSSCSVGISLFQGERQPLEELLSRSDTAMYEAKKAGRNTWRFFDPDMQRTLEARVRMEAWLRAALAGGQLRLHYQVQVDRERRPLGAEALLRWAHPSEGMIPPGRFIPLAEETGLIVPIGDWVLHEACRQLAAWAAAPATGRLAVSVNVSARQFHQSDFVARVRGALEAHRADPARLTLELTESILIQNVEDAVLKMRELKCLGLSFSMDDFGTGYSSLSYLKRLPLDQLKIDQGFVRNIATDPSDAAIVQTIISMGRSLGLEVIAEGVETEEQLALLQSHGCEAFQGYLFGRPVAPEQLAAALPGGQDPGAAPTGD